MSVGTEGSGPNPRTYSRADYAALEAENARLLAANLDCVAHFEQMRAQLAAMQGGMGEAEKHEAQPEVAENTGSHAMATNQLPRQEQAVARDVEGVAAPCEASPGDDIFAWATFDGEGSYDLRLLDGNESYRDDFRRNNPKHHPDWVFPLYRNSITAAMAAEVGRWERSFRDIHEPALRDAHAYIQELRAELAEVKGREAVAWIVPDFGFLFPTEDAAQRYLRNINDLRKPTALYTAKQPGPDVRALVNADDVRDACANAVSVFAEEANADQCREVAEYMREVLLALIARRTALAASTGQEVGK